MIYLIVILQSMIFTFLVTTFHFDFPATTTRSPGHSNELNARSVPMNAEVLASKLRFNLAEMCPGEHMLGLPQMNSFMCRVYIIH